MAAMVTREQVIALAPDSASLKSANGLASLGKWGSMGADVQAVWGECKGSGARPYQTQVDLSELTSRCSCPSRKFPCKHALALLLLYAQQVEPLATTGSAPQWVQEWLAARKERAAKKEERVAAKAAAPVDPKKQAQQLAKRQNARWKNIESGAQELSRWITDHFQRGFATFDQAQQKEGRGMAARMVDAQAPGLGRLLSDALELFDGVSQQQQGMEKLGLVQLLASAALRKDALSPKRLADVQTALGWNWEKEDLLGQVQAGQGADMGAYSLKDRWLVLGQCIEVRDSRLTERRVWLYGLQSGQYALLLDFAFQGKGLGSAWASQGCYEGTVVYYPGSVPLRALSLDLTLVEFSDEPVKWPHIPLPQAVDSVAQRFAQNPWLMQVPLLLEGVIIRKGGETWLAHSAEAVFELTIKDLSAWQLMAYSAGRPLALFAEWNGRYLNPLAASHLDEGFKSLGVWSYVSQGDKA